MKFIETYKYKILFFLLFLAFLFLRFYQFFERGFVGWDQADSAWGAHRILYEHFLTLQGVPMKGNAGMYLGPLYYYLIAPFYFFTRQDMSASLIFAGFISIISFIIFYVISKKMFNSKVAFVSSIFYIFAIGVIDRDRLQAAYVLIPTISYLVFYFMYEILQGKEKYLLYLATIIGFGFHVHFTTIFYPIIILFTLPFFPRTKKCVYYALGAVGVFLFFTFPLWFPIFFAKHVGSSSIMSYLHSSYHGFHIKRMLQIANDAFISFEGIFMVNYLKPLVYLLLPVFSLFLLRYHFDKRQYWLFIYLSVLWIIIPWIVFTTYSGELTDYYFGLPRNIGFVMIAFIFVSLFELKNIFIKLLVVCLITFFAGYNLYLFSIEQPGNYLSMESGAKATIAAHKTIKFKDRDPSYYTFFIYTKYKNLACY